MPNRSYQNLTAHRLKTTPRKLSIIFHVAEASRLLPYHMMVIPFIHQHPLRPKTALKHSGLVPQPIGEDAVVIVCN